MNAPDGFRYLFLTPGAPRVTVGTVPEIVDDGGDLRSRFVVAAVVRRMRTEAPILTDLPVIARTIETPIFPIIVDRRYSLITVIMRRSAIA